MASAEAVMTPPPAASAPDAGDNTTIQVSRLQRAQISDIQADLVIARGRHVSTKETIGALIDFWKEHHRDDTDS